MAISAEPPVLAPGQPAPPFVPDPDLAALGWSVPTGRPLDLPGRGTTFVRDFPGPHPGAPVVFLLHGLAANGALNWFAAFAPLAEHFRVVAIDHRGHGRGIRSTTRFRLADCADDVVAVADALGIERFIPVGYSMGGPISQLIWHRHRSRVEAMVMCATSRNFRGTTRERVQFMALGAVVAARIPFWERREVTRLRTLVEGLLTPEFSGRAMRQWIVRQLHQNDTRKVVEAAECLGRYSSHSWIGEIDVPVSVVVADADQLVPVRRQAKLARSIPSAVIFPVEGDHLVAARYPDRFVPVLLDACLLASRRARRGLAAIPS